MSRRVTLKLTLELLSDAIFGSGYSIPGGEDIAVYRDGAGHPYLRGSTCKGLLRESLANLLAWTGGDESTLDAMMGEEGWNGITGRDTSPICSCHGHTFTREPIMMPARAEMVVT